MADQHTDVEVVSAHDDLTLRVPGEALMAECLRLQAGHPRRRVIGRVFGTRVLPDEARSWYVGAMGERATARVLESLGPEYVVMHSVPVSERGTDIDHLVVGPSGIVTINTKHLRDAKVWVAGDTVLVAGRRQQFVRAARAERRRVQGVLDTMTLPVTPITAMVAVVGAAQVVVREAPTDVVVIEARRLLRAFRDLPHVLEPDAVWALAGVVSSRTTWLDARPAGADELGLVARFAALEREVRIARVARLAWTGGLCAGVAGGLVGVAAIMSALMAALSAGTGS